MSRKTLSTEEILILLAQAPVHLAALSEGVAPARLHTTPSQDEWSANDVLAHLRSCSDVWGKCIITILSEDTPTIRAINPTAWIKSTNYRELEFAASLDSFSKQRTELLAILEALPPESWLRTATVTGAGNVLTRTVLSYAQRLGIHERPHLKQIKNILTTMPNTKSG